MRKKKCPLNKNSFEKIIEESLQQVQSVCAWQRKANI